MTDNRNLPTPQDPESPGEEPQIIDQDDSILVINKPAGWVVNRAKSVKAYTLQDWVEARLSGDLAWEKGRGEDETFRERSGMVHRLDKDTSGVILFAKTPQVMYDLMAQFKQRQVQKTYLALVHEHFSQPAGVVSVGIQRHPRDRERFSVSSAGRPSVTQFEVVQEYAGISVETLQQRLREQGESTTGLHKLMQIYQGFSLVQLQPKTGRTHQLRVHLKFLHHPIVGDERYVGRKRYRADALWCPRQWLHAWKIEFVYPQGTPKKEYTAEIPSDLQRALELLQ